MQNEASFSFLIKNELSKNEVGFEEAKSILAGFLKVNGILNFGRGEPVVIFKTENNDTAKFLYLLLKRNFPNLELSISFVKSMKLYKSIEYHLKIVSGATEFLDQIYFDLLETKIPYELKKTNEGLKGYLIGTFLASGSCNNPQSSNYHLEMSVNDEKYAYELLKLIKKIKVAEFDFKVIQRRSKYVLYIKKSEQISDFLAYIDASNACLEFENIRINRDFLNSTNRLMNCDTNNFNKTLESSLKQIEMIKYLDKVIGLDCLQNRKFAELCKLRLEQPEANYNELANELSERLEKPVSKSNVNHLFIKLKNYYEELTGNEKN